MDWGRMQELEKQSSMFYWFPKIATLGNGIRVPKTVMIQTDFSAMLAMIMEGRPEDLPTVERTVEDVRVAANLLGWPVFLRTDQLSDKHSWRRTCYCPDLETLSHHMGNLTESSYMLLDMQTQSTGFAVREFLRLKSSFTAFEGMPVAREFRFFVEGDKVIHWQPYWPPDSIREPSATDWRELLAEMNEITAPEFAVLEAQSVTVGRAIPGQWSVDFAQDVDGKWWLIDMARGEVSFKWEVAA